MVLAPFRLSETSISNSGRFNLNRSTADAEPTKERLRKEAIAVVERPRIKQFIENVMKLPQLLFFPGEDAALKPREDSDPYD